MCAGGISLSTCFNLVIENLLISTIPRGERGRNVGVLGFNLVIENLLISTKISHPLRIAGCKFQSRNRESSNFNRNQTHSITGTYMRFNLVIENLLISTQYLATLRVRYTLFQSRNRESSNFNPALWEALPDVL